MAVDLDRFREPSAVLSAREGDREPLIELLKEGKPLAPETMLFVAELLEGKHTRARGRPRKQPHRATAWTDRAAGNPAFLAAIMAKRTMLAWRQRRGGQRKFVNRNGQKVSVKEEAIRRAIARLTRRTGGRKSADYDAVLSIYDDPGKWV